MTKKKRNSKSRTPHPALQDEAFGGRDGGRGRTYCTVSVRVVVAAWLELAGL